MVNGGFAGLSAGAALALLKRRLQAAGIDGQDASFEAAQLLRLATGQDARLRFEPLKADEAARLEELCRRRAAREPLQYLAGRWPFLDFELEVGPGVLIPRPDTELLCLAAADCLRRMGAKTDAMFAARLGGWPATPGFTPKAPPPAGVPQVLDVCAGSGCVGLGIARLAPGAAVTAVEKSEDAWPYPARNTRGSAVAPQLADAFGFETQMEQGGLWLLAANPPYVTRREMAALAPELGYEPAMALQAEEEGLAFYRYFAAHYPPLLQPGGWMAFEIGWRQGPAVEKLLREAGAAYVQILQDTPGRDRVVRACF